MKLEAVELRRIKLDLVAPFETSFGVQTEKDVLLVKVLMEGAEGWGEWQDPEFLRSIEPAATKLTLADGQSAVTLRVLVR